MSDLLAALGLLLVIEGVLYLAFPRFMRAMAERVRESVPRDLQVAGAVAAIVGLGLVWLVRR